MERVKVEFENDAAGRIFYEALSKSHGSPPRTESNTEFELPIVFEHKRRVISGPNTTFNEGVEVCDTNKDGRITEPEARIFAEQRQKRK
ncbi:MAG: hypothetical protein FJ403_15470 [Verrucomicrobia bacterium]|nr:hypothetical protein [Verrucomicrobiota bacterium]